MSDRTRFEQLMLETTALGYAASVNGAADSESAVGHWKNTSAAHRSAALIYAASLGDVTAAERAELETLRRFRDGIFSLRAELTACSDLNLVKETIDALIAMSFPMKMERK